MNWMILPLKRALDFGGRSRRVEFWMFVLFSVLVGVGAAIVDLMLGYGASAAHSGAGGYDAWVETRGPAGLISSLLLVVPQLAVSVRRLHDINRTGWWLLLLLLPLVGWLVLLVFYVTEGTRGQNRFGPDPTASPQVAAES